MSAERTLEQLLGEVYPDHTWVVSRRQRDALDGTSGTAAAVVVHDPGASTQDHRSLAGGDGSAASNGPHDDGFQEAA